MYESGNTPRVLMTGWLLWAGWLVAMGGLVDCPVNTLFLTCQVEVGIVP